MITKHDDRTRDLFPLHLRVALRLLDVQATDRCQRAAFFRKLGYNASACRLEDEAVRIEAQALKLGGAMMECRYCPECGAVSEQYE